jgi:LacI family transcriptional regulator
MKKGSSIRDIANKLGVSVTTVSFILNGKAEENRISKSLADKVVKYAKDQGYVPNQLARSLRLGKTHILGLLVEDISNPFFGNIAGQIEEVADKRGYKIFYCSAKNSMAKTKELIKVFEERQVDGYIITPVEGIQEKIKSLLNNRNRVILFDRYFPDIDTNYVVVDNEEGAYLATAHLARQGYKKIAFITIVSEQTQMKGRLEGYKKALKENKLKPLVKKLAFNEDSGKLIGEIKEFLEKNKAVDAVFFGTNYLGVSGLEAIKRLNLKIPSDIGVVSFDDHDLFRLHSPAVTAVAQPIEKISENLINILLDQIENADHHASRHIVIPPSLIIRESSIRSKK